MPKRINIAGKAFGRLTVIEFSRVKQTGSGSTQHFWRCRCECGVEKDVDGGCLRRGTTLSCGCHGRERSTSHGMSNHPLYQVWLGIKQRCTNPNSECFKDYGARGIAMCSRWLNSFADFYADMGDRPTPSHTVERIENAKGYEPGNCRWATRAEQNENTRQTKLITFDGITLSRSKWARRIGIDRSVLRSRLNALGWSVERALTTPQRTKRKTIADS